ncbi:MAG: rhamnulokinase, partial [Actinomycetota bacterium]
MTAQAAYLAADLGAESGRLVRGTLNRARALEVTEVHRWANAPVRVEDRLFWDALYLWKELKRGLSKA